MAMFANQGREGDASLGAETHIGPSVKMEGTFAGDGDVVIEGILVGQLSTKGDLRVGPQASIEAELRSKNATIAGKVKGNITVTNSLKLAPTANVSGDIKALSLSVDDGAVINGKLIMCREKTSRENGTHEPIADKPKLS